LAPFFLPTISNEQGFTFKTLIEANESNSVIIYLFYFFTILLQFFIYFYNEKRSEKVEKPNLFLSDFAVKLSRANQVEHCKSIVLSFISSFGLNISINYK